MRKTPKKQAMKHGLLERLIHYYYFMMGRHAEDPEGAVRSQQLAAVLHVDDSLVRRDLAAVGVQGHHYAGYRTAEVLEAIRTLLGFDQTFRAVIVGAGRLGCAMAAYPGFAALGVEICGLFDIAPQKAGLTLARFQIEPMSALKPIVRNLDARIAILTVPVDVAQECADQAVAAGIQAIWNFASVDLRVPEHVLVRHEHIAVGLAELTHYLNSANKNGESR